MSIPNLKKTVLETICWFDIFDQPLSLFEVWRYLYLENNELVKYKISDVQEVLENSEALKEIIDFKKGYYFLKSNSKDLAKIRTERYNIAEQKFKKAKRMIKILARFPFIKMIAICNTLAYRGANRGSDIDLFIITEKNRIWWARFLVVGFLSVFNLRPKQNDLKDKLCLSFFIDTEHLNIKNVSKDHDQDFRVCHSRPDRESSLSTSYEDKLDFRFRGNDISGKISDRRESHDNDIYLMYWIDQLLPVYDDRIYTKFYQSNSWIKNYLPFSEKNVVNKKLTIKLGLSGKLIKKIWQSKINLLAGDWTEKILKQWQIKKMPQALKNKLNNSTDVMISKGLIKLHLNDRRDKFYKLWREKLKTYEK